MAEGLSGSGETVRDLLARAIDQSALACLLVDSNRTIIYANPVLDRLYVQGSESLRGHDLKVLWGDQMCGDRYRTLWESLSGEGRWLGLLEHSGGVTRQCLELTLTRIRMDSVSESFFFGQVQPRGAHADYGAQVHQSRKFEAIGQLASGIAHEINTPTQYIGDNLHFFKDAFGGIIRLIRAYDALCAELESEVLAAAGLKAIRALREEVDLEFFLAETPDAIERSIEGNRRVAEVVRAMKEFAHPSATSPMLADLNHGIRNTISVSRNEWKYIATVETRFAPDMPLVPCIPGAFNQVVLNIVVNAAHAIAEATEYGRQGKGVITIDTNHDADWAIVRISDTGTGIPEYIGQQIFNPFFTTKPIGQGTGQGLAIARSVIEELHRGALSFQSETGKGTTFEIRIPLHWPEEMPHALQ